MEDKLRVLWRQSAIGCTKGAGINPSDPVTHNSRRADCMRSLICQLHFARHSKKISKESSAELLLQHVTQYSQIVDDFKGLNNFSDEAIEIASSGNYINESKNWVSSFQDATVDDLKKLLPILSNKSKAHTSEPTDSQFQELMEAYNKVPTSGGHQTCLPEIQRNPFLEGNSVQKSAAFVPSITSSAYTKEGFNDAKDQSYFSKEAITYKNQRAGVSSFKTSNYNSALDNSELNSLNTREPGFKRKFSAEHSAPTSTSAFRTAKEKFIQDADKNGGQRKSLGSRRNVSSKFIPPLASKSDSEMKYRTNSKEKPSENEEVDERLKNIDPKMIEIMNNEIMDNGPPVSWDDIAGLKFAKKTIQEIVVWPMLRPDIFTGLCSPPRGILLFGPPGTGKTLIGKCIASQSKSTFFCISSSSLTSKWVGEGEKLVRALFAVARCHQPAVIFIDEIDSLLTQRSDSEHESSRRIKTEFLVHLDGATTTTDERLLIVGATNRPQELDEAARRRLVKRLYIPLPESDARRTIILKLLMNSNHSLSEEHLNNICQKSEGYSGADMANLCKEAALGPIRDLTFNNIEDVHIEQVRPIKFEDFVNALKQVRASVSDKDLQLYEDWNNKYGSFPS